MAEWTVVGTSEANTAKTITKAAANNKRHYITAFCVVSTGAAVGAETEISIKDGDTTVWKTYFSDSSEQGAERKQNFGRDGAIPLSYGNAANLSVGAGGAGCIYVLNLKGFTGGR